MKLATRTAFTLLVTLVAAACDSSDAAEPAVVSKSAEAREAQRPELPRPPADAAAIAHVEAWFDAVRLQRAEAAEALADAELRVDTKCGNTPECLMRRAGQLLRYQPKTMESMIVEKDPTGRRSTVWVMLAFRDFVDETMGKADIRAEVVRTERGALRIEKMTIDLWSR